MGNGYPVIQPNEMAQYAADQKDIYRRLRELERPTGSQRNETVKQLQDLVNGLINQTNITATGNVTAGGTGTFAAGVTSAGVYNLDVSALPGTRRTDWVNQNGQIGYAPSTRAKKTNLRAFDVPASAFLACIPQYFEYLAQRAIRDDPENAYYDPSYTVPTDAGQLAEDLIANGLEQFVDFEEDGVTPAGIDYIMFSAVGMVVIGREMDARLRALEGNRSEQ